MIQQFQNVLQSPKQSSQNYLKMIQDTMLNTMQELMPKEFDFAQLAKIFEKQNQHQSLASFTFQLTQFFAKVMAQNFISLQTYFALEQQTQKLQSTIRSHIKMQQEMKMYLEHLQYKIERYEFRLRKIKINYHQNGDYLNESKYFNERDSFEQLKTRQTQLLKERLVLLRKVDHLERKLQDQDNQLRRLNSPTSATIQQIKEGMNRANQTSEIKIPCSTDAQNVLQSNKFQNDMPRILSTNSFGSDYQITQKKSSNSMKAVHNYHIYSLNGKQLIPSHNLPSIQIMQTTKQIPFTQSYSTIWVQNDKY